MNKIIDNSLWEGKKVTSFSGICGFVVDSDDKVLYVRDINSKIHLMNPDEIKEKIGINNKEKNNGNGCSRTK